MINKKGKRNYIDIILLIVIALLPLFIFYTILHFAGPQWDIMVRYLAGRTLVNFLTHKISAKNAFVGELINNKLYYFEPYREPLSMPIFAFLDIFFQKSVFPYIVVVYVGFILALYELGSQLKIDKVILFSVFINSYVVYFFFMLNGGEALSLIFVFLGLVYLFRKKSVSGFFFGLATIAKYPSLLTLPLVLFIEDKKKRLEAILLGLVPIFIWGGIDYLLYGVPFYSYFESIGASNVLSGASSISLLAIAKVLVYPALFLAIGIVVLLIKKEKLNLKQIKLDYTNKILIAFTGLALVGYIAVLPHNDPITQSRYGYIFGTALLIISALVINYAYKKSKKGNLLKYAVLAIAIFILIYAIYSTYITYDTPAVIYYNANNYNGLFTHAETELSNLGWYNCRVISNAWVPMIYSGYDAYSPFILYDSKVITPIVKNILNETGMNSTNSSVNSIIGDYAPHNSSLNYTTYVSQESRYPILVFKYTGVSNSFIINLNGSTLAYNDQNISIYLPRNVSCYKN